MTHTERAFDIEGYTPAAPVARIKNNSDSKQGRQFDVIVFPTLSYSTPLHSPDDE